MTFIVKIPHKLAFAALLFQEPNFKQCSRESFSIKTGQHLVRKTSRL